MVATTLFAAWADLLQYPAEGGAERVRRRVDQLREARPDLGEDLQPMLDYVQGHGETELEEVFTRTFDSNAERALEIGWHIHGENYARGVFMVRMRKLLREHEVEESSELPDHLSHVLSVLARADDDLATAMASGVVSPALVKITEGFSDHSNPYFGVVTSLKRYIDGGFAPGNYQGSGTGKGKAKESGL